METVAAATPEGDKHPHPEFVLVAVYTTSGPYPKHGNKREKVTEIVAAVLKEAARALNLTDTSTWIATVDGRDIDPAKTFAANHLTGTVVVHWGPREGGGG
jgi:hypothetical protein